MARNAHQSALSFPSASSLSAEVAVNLVGGDLLRAGVNAFGASGRNDRIAAATETVAFGLIFSGEVSTGTAFICLKWTRRGAIDYNDAAADDSERRG